MSNQCLPDRRMVLYGIAGFPGVVMHNDLI
jgi:hypothetical protein